QKVLAILGGKYPEPSLLALWNHEREQLEADLARRVPEMDLHQRLRAIDRRTVATALPAGSALVEFVHFHIFDFKGVPARGEPTWLPPRYLAFVLLAADPEHVRMIALGEAEPIDQLIAEFRAGITGEASHPHMAGDGQAGVRLRAAVFDPLV